jgi:hypothetical protein
MWSKVVRKGEKWWLMATGAQIRKLAARAMFPVVLSFDMKLPGKCPK